MPPRALKFFYGGGRVNSCLTTKCITGPCFSHTQKMKTKSHMLSALIFNRISCTWQQISDFTRVVVLPTFTSLVHGPRVSATLALVVHPEGPHFPVLGQDARVGLSHCNLGHNVAFQVGHLACGDQTVMMTRQRN